MNIFTDGFDSPVGTAFERSAGTIWPGSWMDTNPFGNKFEPLPGRPVLHTGADLNLPHDADAHKQVTSIANGLVRYAYQVAGSYGGVVVIQHAVSPTEVVYSRYEHLESISTRVGRVVMRGEGIGAIGNAHGIFQYHLHFDMTKTSLLASNPLDWVNADQDKKLKENYIEPRPYLMMRRPLGAKRYSVINTSGLLIRQSPYGLQTGVLNRDQVVTIQGITKLSWTNVAWGRIAADNGMTIGYCAMDYLRPLQ